MHAARVAAPRRPTWQVNQGKVHRSSRHLHNHNVPAELQPCLLPCLRSPQAYRVCCCRGAAMAKAADRMQRSALAAVVCTRP
jgi:hypothetical protein